MAAMKEFVGISASPGIAIGKVFLYQNDTLFIPKYDISHIDVPKEHVRFKEAVQKASVEILALKNRMELEFRNNESALLDSHLLMLSDPDLEARILHLLKQKLTNVEWILLDILKEIEQKLNASEDKYMRERSMDINDISQRLLYHLMEKERTDLSNLQDEAMLVSHNLLPSEFLNMNKNAVKGLALDAGGRTSHTAILAKSFEIPAVVGLGSITSKLQTGDLIIIDGNSGKVIANPIQEILEKYVVRRKVWQQREKELLVLNQAPAETSDGKRVLLNANIEVPEEVDSVLAHGADAIGLYRSEFFFIHSGAFASEELQFNAYVTVLKLMQGKSVTIRTLDAGGDKMIPEIGIKAEKNPILGWRAVRFCLERVDIFKTQLRALLRASVYGNLKIMFPMISGISELLKVLEVLEEVKHDLLKEGIEYNTKIPIGCMIEVPSAALTADFLAKKVDFFSIGTNDLIQYTIAVDRGNEKIAYLYEPFHPGVLRLIRMVIHDAHQAGIPVAMCGEMASDPLASVLLLGMGLDEYSMSAFSIPEIKKIVRSISYSEAKDFAQNILEINAIAEVNRYIRDWMVSRFDLFLDD